MISKKDLLKTMEISYGQLYRWKREGLIPDDWFIKQSVSTGQETYFKRDLIIPRVKKILELKDQYQLEELKDLFNSSDTNNLSARKAILIDDINPYYLKIYLENRKEINLYELAIIYILSKNENVLDGIRYLKPNAFKNTSTKFIYICKHKEESFIIWTNDEIILDDNIQILSIENIEDAISFIARKLKED